MTSNALNYGSLGSIDPAFFKLAKESKEVNGKSFKIHANNLKKENSFNIFILALIIGLGIALAGASFGGTSLITQSFVNSSTAYGIIAGSLIIGGIIVGYSSFKVHKVRKKLKTTDLLEKMYETTLKEIKDSFSSENLEKMKIKKPATQLPHNLTYTIYQKKDTTYCLMIRGDDAEDGNGKLECTNWIEEEKLNDLVNYIKIQGYREFTSKDLYTPENKKLF